MAPQKLLVIFVYTYVIKKKKTSKNSSERHSTNFQVHITGPFDRKEYKHDLLSVWEKYPNGLSSAMTIAALTEDTFISTG